MGKYTTPLLFHGPSAKQRALEDLPKIGRLIHPPFGGDGLKIDESRSIIELLSSAPVGDSVGAILVGPMCRATRGATDVLLKSIEEFNPNTVRPVLWALGAADVSNTIRSRCILRWCPGQEVLPPGILEAAREAVRSALAEDWASLVLSLKEQDEELLLRASAEVLMEMGFDLSKENLWKSLREALRRKDPSRLELLAAFLPGPT